MNVGGNYNDFINVYALCRTLNCNILETAIKDGMRKGKYEDENAQYYCNLNQDAIAQLSSVADYYYTNRLKGLNAFFFRFEKKLSKES